MARPHAAPQRAPDAAPPVEPPAAPAAAQDAPPAPDPGRCYGPGRGFTWRREAFGGILYHYEGVQPDPRVTFVDNAFLLELLDALQAHPHVPLGALCAAVQARFGLDAAERGRVDAFFATLIARGALVPQ
jgi:hypothetical protein